MTVTELPSALILMVDESVTSGPSNTEAVHVYCPASLRLKLLIVRMLVSVRSAINTLVREPSSGAPLGPVQLHENKPSLATVHLTCTEETRLSLPNSIPSEPGKNVISLLLVMLTKKKIHIIIH